jgi:hypothetical protein
MMWEAMLKDLEGLATWSAEKKQAKLEEYAEIARRGTAHLRKRRKELEAAMFDMLSLS